MNYIMKLYFAWIALVQAKVRIKHVSIVFSFFKFRF